METKTNTELKDCILLYLYDRAKEKISLSEIYYDLKLDYISKEFVNDFIEDMVLEKLIEKPLMQSNKNVYSITERGKRRLRVKGYLKLSGIEFDNILRH